MTIEVAVSRTVKVNLGDYESTDFFVSMKDDATEETVAEVRKKLRRTINTALANDIFLHFKKRGKKVSLQSVKRRYGLV